LLQFEFFKLTIVPVPLGQSQGQSKDQKVIVSKQGRIVKLTSEMDSLVNSLQNDTSHIEIGQGVTEISKFKNFSCAKNRNKVKSLKVNNSKTIGPISLKFYN